MYPAEVTDQTWLRGVQIADADGRVTFRTIVPGCYPGRWPHVHFEVFPDAASITDAANNVLTSQIALPEEMSGDVYATAGYDGSTGDLAAITLAEDNVFSDGWERQTPQYAGDPTRGHTVSIDVAVDARTEQAVAGMPPGGMGGPGGMGSPTGPPPGMPTLP